MIYVDIQHEGRSALEVVLLPVASPKADGSLRHASRPEAKAGYVFRGQLHLPVKAGNCPFRLPELRLSGEVNCRDRRFSALLPNISITDKSPLLGAAVPIILFWLFHNGITPRRGQFAFEFRARIFDF